MTQQRHVTIIGGGLIGLTTALFAREEGAEVRIIDSGPLGGGASRGNAGLMSSSIMAPLAAPGAVWSAIRSLPRADTPLRLHPRVLPSHLGWFLRFALSCTAARYERSQRALGQFLLDSIDGLDRVRAAGVSAPLGPSLLAPFHDERAAEHFLRGLAPMRDYGFQIPDGLLSGDETRRIVPALTDHVTCGVDLPAERLLDPVKYVDSLIGVVASRGVELLPDHAVRRIEGSARRVTAVSTDRGNFDVDEVVLCAGAGIRRLGRLAGVSIPVIPGQGYNFELPPSASLTVPVITEEAHAVATPLEGRIRLGGTMEFGGDTPGYDPRRIEAIIRSSRRFLDLDWSAVKGTWAGLRPMSPDGVPIIGRPKRWENAVIAGGHGMYGLSLAPATALAVTALVLGREPQTDLSAFSPRRFGQ